MNGSEVKKHILVIDDDQVLCEAVKDFLTSPKVEVLTAHTAADGLAVSSSRKIDIVLLDQQLPDAEGYTLCPAILKHNDQTKIIFSTAFPSFDNAVKAIRAGAYNYLSKPFDLEELGLSIRQALRTLELEGVEQVQDYQRSRESEDAVIIGGEGFSDTRRLVELAASSTSPVLITGETGTGKTLVAKAIHYRSKAAKFPFISINCASLPENLIESELFGYEKGAFTGAVASRKGIFEMAEGGTLFLDEIGELPLHLQAKLLSVIEEKQMRRLGSEALRPVNARIMAATNSMVEESLGKTFRKDLYYRLSVIRIHIPPLRDRCADIPELCRHILKSITGGREIVLSQSELLSLSRYDWPGNIRELENCLERGVIMARGEIIAPADLPPQIQALSQAKEGQGFGFPSGISLQEVEKALILKTLEDTGGNRSRAAEILGINRRTLQNKLKEYGI